MQTKPNRRTYGTGSLITIGGVYYGKWRANGRQVKRRIGTVRTPGSRDGLTKAHAEARLRDLIREVTPTSPGERLTVAEAAEALLSHLVAQGRKPSTIRSYRSLLASQIKPRLGDRMIDRLTRDEVEAWVLGCRGDGLAPKTTKNLLGFLHSVCDYAVDRGWASANPCRGVTAPRSPETTDIRFLDNAEVEALLEAVPSGPYARVYRALYLAAVMTGLRQGELLALRWRDVDWCAQRVRVRRNLVRGEFGTPKSRRGSRAVPLADRLGGELDQLYKASAYQADDDLVFGNPHTGKPLNGNAVLKSFQRALEAGGVRRVRFHDLRHTFGTRMAAAGVPIRTLQEWMGHRDLTTTQIYADYAPGAHEVDLVNGAFATDTEQRQALCAPTEAAQR